MLFLSSPICSFSSLSGLSLFAAALASLGRSSYSSQRYSASSSRRLSKRSLWLFMRRRSLSRADSLVESSSLFAKKPFNESLIWFLRSFTFDSSASFCCTVTSSACICFCTSSIWSVFCATASSHAKKTVFSSSCSVFRLSASWAIRLILAKINCSCCFNCSCFVLSSEISFVKSSRCFIISSTKLWFLSALSLDSSPADSSSLIALATCSKLALILSSFPSCKTSSLFKCSRSFTISSTRCVASLTRRRPSVSFKVKFWISFCCFWVCCERFTTFFSNSSKEDDNLFKFSVSFFILISSSSSSRFRPSKLLLFLKAPPVIDPPGFNSSPSSVTMRRLLLYFAETFIPWSIVSTTTILPSKNDTNLLYISDVLTRLLASPITPGSFNASFCENSSRTVIASSGKNVARPKRPCFKYSIMCFAVCSVSVTIFWIAPPSAVSIAVS